MKGWRKICVWWNIAVAVVRNVHVLYVREGGPNYHSEFTPPLIETSMLGYEPNCIMVM